MPGQVWHITHRCHERDFLLEFAQDRKCWRYWLFEVRRRYGWCVLNYIVTSNHIHLLVKDTADAVISKSLQLIAGRTAQEYNKRKTVKRPFGKIATMQRLLRPESTWPGALSTLI